VRETGKDQARLRGIPPPVLDGPHIADTLTMLVFRPITPDDLPQLSELAAAAGIGLTTLPKDPQLAGESDCRVATIF
jgi:hypothetical protein